MASPELLAQLATASDSGILYRAVAALDNAIWLVHEERESKYAIWPDGRAR